MHDPLRDPILSFSHTFSLKSAHVGGQRPPPNGLTAPTGEPGSASVVENLNPQHGGKCKGFILLKGA